MSSVYFRYCFKMVGLSLILKEALPNLKKLYEVNHPIHVVTTVAIGHFIERFRKKPEWEKKVKFWSLNDNWKETGTFAMVNANDNHIFTSTLEPWPYESLRRTLDLLNYDKPMVFVCFRDEFRPIIFDVLRVQNLEVTFDSGTKTIYLPHKDIKADITAPDGYYFDSLHESNVEKINSTWMGRHAASFDYLKNCVAQSPSTGLFSKQTGELAAWAMTLETGCAGNMQVDNKYQGSDFGKLVSGMQANKIGKELGYDVIGHIAHYNKLSFHLTTKMDFQWMGNTSWIGVRQKPFPKLVPLWGI